MRGAPPAPRLVAALREQLAARERLLAAGAERVGWKIATEIPEIDAVTGGAPAIGYLTTAGVLPEAGTYDAAGDRELRAETELVIDIGADGAVAGFAVGLELVDVARPPGDLEGIVAANVLHRAAVLGPPHPAAAAPFGAATLEVGGEPRDTAAVDVDVPATVRAVAALLESVGERLEPGDRILAGSSCHVPVRPGDEVTAEIAGLGRVSARVAG
jgi:2-keto-4-pentenoate hydratase